MLAGVSLPSRCALVTAGDETRIVGALSPDPDPALKAVAKLTASDGAGPGLVEAVAQGVEMVRGRREVRSQIVVLTDRGASAIETRNQQDLQAIRSAQSEMGDQLEIVIVDVGTGDVQNLAIVEAELRGRQARIGDDAHVLARVRNCGQKAQSARLSLTVPGTQDAPFRDLTLEPSEEVLVDLTTRVNRSAATFAEVKLAVKDALEHDNQSSTPFVVAPPRRVLIVNGARDRAAEMSVEGAQLASLGAHGTEAALSEEEAVDGARILQFALNPGRELGLAFGTGIETTQITPEALPAQPLSKYDIIVLYDVSRLGGDLLGDLEAFVREGRSLLIFCSSALDPMEFKSSFAIPGKDRPALSPAQMGNDLAFDPPLTIDLGDASEEQFGPGIPYSPYPWLSPFRDRRRGDLSVVRMRKVRGVREIRPGASVLLRSDRGHALAIEAKRGQGRVVLLAFGLELNRGNLAMTKVFPLLTWRLADYVTGRLRVKPPDTLVASTAATLDASEAAFSFMTELELCSAQPDWTTRLKVSEQKTVLAPALPVGRYWLQKAQSKALGLGVGYKRPVAVNHDPRESNVARVSDVDLRQLLGERVRLTTLADAAALTPRGAEAWRLVVVLLVLAYLAEAVSAYVLGRLRDREREMEEA